MSSRHPVPAAGRGRLRNKLADSGERTFRARPHRGRRRPHDDSPPDGARPRPAPVARTRPHGAGRTAPARRVQRRGAGCPRSTGSRGCGGSPHCARRPAHGRPRRSPVARRSVRWRWKNLPVPPPEPQVEVHVTDRVAFIDVGNEALRFGVEFQGVEWHTGDDRERRTTRGRHGCRDEPTGSSSPSGPPTSTDATHRLEDIIVDGVRRARGRQAVDDAPVDADAGAHAPTRAPRPCAHAPTRRRSACTHAPTRRALRAHTRPLDAGTNAPVVRR